MHAIPKPIKNNGIHLCEFRKEGLGGANFLALYAYMQGITNKIMLPKIPAVKLKAT
jgi:hypothetical protein